MKLNNNIKALIFDFGNVIINIDFDLTFQAFEQMLGKDYKKVIDQWKSDGYMQKIESDPFTAQQMAETINQYGVNLSGMQVEEAWNALLLDIPPARIKLLKKLSKKYPLYLLSNTNKVHIEKIFGDLESEFGENPLLPLFEHLFLSYKMGAIKPNEAIYKQVADFIPFEPSECIFFDDLQENLDGAAALGFQTQLVTKEEGILELLGN